MSYEVYEAYKPQKEARQIIWKARSIISSYMAQGLTLTLRQLYYQFVAQDLIPNTEKSYKRLGNIISRARLGGYLDWDAIEDRARQPVVWREFESTRSLLDWASRSYRLPRLKGQPVYVELWVEKDALAGVLEPLAARYHVTLMVNRGYSSSSAMKDSADRIRSACVRNGSQEARILYLGDMDPSGEDMVRDIKERIDTFTNEGLLIDWDAEEEDGGPKIEDYSEMRERQPQLYVGVQKLALTMAQVKQYQPPPNPAKLTDSRAKEYIKKYGRSSWEVDALPPNVLQDLIRKSLEQHLDMELMDEVIEQEKQDKEDLYEALKHVRGEK
jgi:hypothetical protein